jgi:hypothetical protein
MRMLFVTLIALLSVSMVLAVDGACTEVQSFGVAVSFGAPIYPTNTNVKVVDNCTNTAEVEWNNINLTFGDIQEGEVVVTSTSVYVDSVARPDLDVPATLTFRDVRFAVSPGLLKDGVVCDVSCANTSYDEQTRVFTAEVSGFSNYTLTGLQQFTVYNDPEPELKSKVYQTIDLGDANRDEQFACVVQIFGKSTSGPWVLIQTNPSRNVPARLLGNPDTNNPESLGYFPTVAGIANVYFDGSQLAGYQDLEYVAQCASNNTGILVYEEALSTRYSPVGRSMTARGVWLTEGSNAVFIIIGVILVILAIWIGAKFWRSFR